MKINGIKVTNTYEETVVLPRQDGNLVFKARAVINFDPFDKLCPPPKAPLIQYSGQSQAVENVEDKDYIKKYSEWAEAKTHWMILESLKASPDLEWETIDMGDHTTWSNYSKEMSDAGLTIAEQSRIVQIVSLVNGLDQTKIDEATESFLAVQAAQAAIQSSRGSAQPVTPSGEPASVLA